jgi:nucleotide-binding universal stress UspA family protein
LTLSYPDVVGTLPPPAYEQAQEQVAIEARALVDKAVAILSDQGISASGALYTGSPAESIMAALQPGDVIVLSSHARQGLARWVIGSTSTKLIRNGQAPVVVVTRESIERASTDATGSDA